jgi:hypothetical protein
LMNRAISSSSSSSSSLGLSIKICYFLLLLLALRAILFLSGCDALIKVLDVVDLFNVLLMIYDTSKHIIGCHPLVGGVLADQDNNTIVHQCVSPHQSLGPLLRPLELLPC